MLCCFPGVGSPKKSSSCSKMALGVASILRTGVELEFLSRRGRNESSQAVYCPEWMRERNRPEGYGLIGSKGNLYHRKP